MEEAITCDSVPCFELVYKPIRLFIRADFLISYIYPMALDPRLSNQETTRLP